MNITAQAFVGLNDTSLQELGNFGDACIGADELSPNTILNISVEGENVRITRNDNQWNEPVDVVYGSKENWTLSCKSE